MHSTHHNENKDNIRVIDRSFLWTLSNRNNTSTKMWMCSFSCLNFFRIRSVQDLQNSIDWMDRLMLNENIFFEIAGQINILAISQMVWLEF